MKKQIIKILTVMAICLIVSVNVFAASYALVDEAALLTADEQTAIASRADELYSEYGVDITIIITNHLESGTLYDYAQSHAAVDYQSDGIVFVHDLSLKEYYTVGRGYGITVVSDAALERIDDVIVPYLQDGEYVDAYMAYLNATEDFLAAAQTGTPYEGEGTSGTTVFLSIIIGIIGGVIIAFVVTGMMISKMNTAVKKQEAANYVMQGSFVLGQSYDRFLHENTTRTEKAKNNTKSNSSRGGKGGGKY